MTRELAARYREFAEYASTASPCFADWALRAADDDEVLRWIARLPAPKQQPNLVFAAARWQGVTAPGPFEGLRAALLDDDGSLRSTILTRATQTNEVGRVAALMPAFARVAGQQPVALVEVGASAGLCLYPDRYDYDWGRAGRLTGSGGPVLTCAATGPVPLPHTPVDVAWRGGIDLHPLDVTDDGDVAWLEMLVWPEQQQRRDRLAVAVAVARRDPPSIVAGDLLRELPSRIDAAAAHGPVIVFHSAVIMYLTGEGRRRFVGMMTELVARGACHWISNESHDVLPEITRTAGVEPELHFTVGVDGRALAWADQHGGALRWL